MIRTRSLLLLALTVALPAVAAPKDAMAETKKQKKAREMKEKEEAEAAAAAEAEAAAKAEAEAAAAAEASAQAEASAGVEAGPGEDGTTPAVEPPVETGGMPPLTLGKGKILITGSTVNIGLFPDNAGKPISLAPAVYYGVSDALTVGVTHDQGSTMWTPRPALTFSQTMIGGVPVTLPAGSGICVTGKDGFCAKVYNNIGFDALFSLKNEKLSLAAHPGIDVNSFDPLVLALRLGVLGRFALNDKMAVVFDPRISIGITERDFNKERIDLPAWFWYMVSAKLGVYVHTGLAGPLDGFGDAFLVPVNVGASFAVNAKLTVGGDFAFLNLLGKDGGTDAKMIGLRVGYAL